MILLIPIIGRHLSHRYVLNSHRAGVDPTRLPSGITEFHLPLHRAVPIDAKMGGLGAL